MAFHGTVDARLVHALGALTELSYAEAWRRVAAVAGRLGLRRPSYPTVRRALLEQRRLDWLRLARSERRWELAADLLSGRVPYRWLHSVIVGTPLDAGSVPGGSRAPPPRRDGGGR